MITSSISHFLSDISSITDLSEKCSKLNAFHLRLQDELRKIQSFKHQLPISIFLLTQAIEKLSEVEIPGCKKNSISPGNVEWSPEQEDMKNWMSSVTLSLKPEIESGVMKKEIETNGQILDFSNKRRDACTSPIETNVDRLMVTSNKKKQRRCWSPELHRLFINALDQLGGAQRATPKYIKDLMLVEDLTNDEIKSHLQKYRMNIRKSPISDVATQPIGLGTSNGQIAYYSWNYECYK